MTVRSTVHCDEPSAHCDEPSAPPTELRAEVGDLLVVDEGGAAGIPAIGVILDVRGADGSPPYLVRWIAGEYESTVMPAAGARIEKRGRCQHGG